MSFCRVISRGSFVLNYRDQTGDLVAVVDQDDLELYLSETNGDGSISLEASKKGDFAVYRTGAVEAGAGAEPVGGGDSATKPATPMPLQQMSSGSSNDEAKCPPPVARSGSAASVFGVSLRSQTNPAAKPILAKGRPVLGVKSNPTLSTTGKPTLRLGPKPTISGAKPAIGSKPALVKGLKKPVVPTSSKPQIVGSKPKTAAVASAVSAANIGNGSINSGGKGSKSGNRSGNGVGGVSSGGGGGGGGGGGNGDAATAATTVTIPDGALAKELPPSATDWTVNHVCVWAKTSKLKFDLDMLKQEEICGKLLLTLGDSELEELKVTSGLARKKILLAIDELKV
jgi:uncharacterized membrane protein YgcG